MSREIATGQFKDDFIKWAKLRRPFNFNKYTKTLTCFCKSFFELPTAFQLSALSEFSDSEEFCIHIEPYLGGGQPAYSASIIYRNQNHIDVEVEVTNKGNAEFWTRFEASEAALIALNDLYNELKLTQKGVNYE